MAQQSLGCIGERAVRRTRATPFTASRASLWLADEASGPTSDRSEAEGARRVLVEVLPGSERSERPQQKALLDVVDVFHLTLRLRALGLLAAVYLRGVDAGDDDHGAHLAL